jgi:hypothetical protein
MVIVKWIWKPRGIAVEELNESLATMDSNEITQG